MPRNLNAWLDICFILFAALILTGILTYYNLFIGLGAGLVWLCLLFFGRERCLCRSEEFAIIFKLRLQRILGNIPICYRMIG